MESKQLKSMSIDQLMDLHQRVQLMLADKLQAEKTKIEERLRRIRSVGGVVARDRLCLNWSRLSVQKFRVDKWSLCRG
jgi:hypothetical protein